MSKSRTSFTGLRHIDALIVAGGWNRLTATSLRDIGVIRSLSKTGGSEITADGAEFPVDVSL